MPSKDNPADEPSRRWEPRWRRGIVEADLPALEEISLQIAPSGWNSRVRLFVHLCSGGRRRWDLAHCIEIGASHLAAPIAVVRVDPLVDADADLFRVPYLDWIIELIVAGHVCGAFGSPPCSTISKARHRPITGCPFAPRPLRSRTNVWNGLPGRSRREVEAVATGSYLMLVCIGLLGECSIRGAWTGLEHPADPGTPYPSFIPTVEFQRWVSQHRLVVFELDQCMFGARTRKPTAIAITPKHTRHLRKRCRHSSHPAMVGPTANGSFATRPMAAYPQGLCEALAKAFVAHLDDAAKHGGGPPLATKPLGVHPLFWYGIGNAVRHNPRTAGWQWPEPRAGFLANILSARNTEEIPSGTRMPQQ